MSSVMRAWVCGLGLRHQGVLLGAICGCDSVPKEDPAKALTRAYRCSVLEPFCGDPRKSSSFIEAVTEGELLARMRAFAGSFDHYPTHFVLHLTHAAEVVGYKGPAQVPYVHADAWRGFYARMCSKMHVTPEAEAELDARLGASEEAFARQRDWVAPYTLATGTLKSGD